MANRESPLVNLICWGLFILAIVLLIGVALGLTVGLYALVALLTQYVVEGLFNYHLPLWPTAGAWFLLSCVGGALGCRK